MPEHIADNPHRTALGKAIGRIPSGLFVLSAARAGEPPVGMLASWIQQASFDPPAVSIAVSKYRPVREIVLETRRVAACVLGDGDSALMRRFARKRAAGTPFQEEGFDGLDVFAAPSGLPVLAGALAWFDCELIDAVDFNADHELLIARVTAGDVLRPGQSFTHVRGTGFHY